MNPESLTYTVTVTNGEGANVSYEQTVAGSFSKDADPLTVAQAMQGSVWEVIDGYVMSLNS